MEDFREFLTDFISPAVLWLIFLVIVLVFVVISVALTYHWKNYNVNSVLVRRLRRVYFWVSGIFLAAMVIALVSYSL